MSRIAYTLRHDGYLSYGYITPRDDGLFWDKYDVQANTKTLILYKNGVPAGTVRVCLYDPNSDISEPQAVPAMEIFRDEIVNVVKSLNIDGRAGRAVEITRLARSPAFANDMEVIAALYRLVGYLILYYDADVVLNACRPHHMPMYRRLGFQKIEEPRQYPNLTYRAGLMACFKAAYDGTKPNFGFLKGISNEDQSYAGLIAGECVPVYSGIAPLPTVDIISRFERAKGGAPALH